MQSSIEKLLEISSPALGSSLELAEFSQTSTPTELLALLKMKNGFFAFEQALHVFPLGNNTTGYNLEEWNKPSLWRGLYSRLVPEGLFFAEDIFGEQFWILDSQIKRFNPETGELEHFSNNLEEWANLLLLDYEVETGYPLAHQWQKLHGRLEPASRLIPKLCFIFGGEYEIANLYCLDAAKAMQVSAAIAHQIQGLPDGTKVRLVIVD